MSLSQNLILMTDAYKVSHHFQYPPGTTHVYSYLESRGGRYPEVVFFGLQYYLQKYLKGSIITYEMIEQAEEFCAKVFGNKQYFNKEGWTRIRKVHDGYLPIVIKALPEGTRVPQRCCMMTVENTDPHLPWLTNYVESLLMKVWYPCTVATRSVIIRCLVAEASKSQGTVPSPFHLNDFGLRGVSSEESAEIGGAAHLLSFMGSDTMPGIACAMEHYRTDVCGYSVAAAEHSTITSWGKENECDAFENLIDRCPGQLVSIVSDSYNLMHAVRNIIGGKLKDKILAREGKVVVRPDSGDPPKVCLEVVQALWDIFGGTTNEKGYKTLNPKVGVIYGDGINEDSILQILMSLHKNGFSTDNVVFGMGGALLQDMTRDTCEFAFKCSSIMVNGEYRDVFKQPVSSTKFSKGGRFRVVKNEKGVLTTVRHESVDSSLDQMSTVFLNGQVAHFHTFDEIKARLWPAN